MSEINFSYMRNMPWDSNSQKLKQHARNIAKFRLGIMEKNVFNSNM